MFFKHNLEPEEVALVMNKTLTGSEILKSAKDHLFNDNQDEELQYAYGSNGYNKVMTNSNYLATQANKSEGGLFLTEAQKKAQEELQLNISGSNYA